MSKPIVFAAAFDGIYQVPSWVEALGGEGSLAQEDLMVSVGLAAVFGHNLSAPARLCVDNLPLIRLCNKHPSWRSLIIEVIRPATPEPDWDTFLLSCGGTATQAPIRMESYDGSYYEDIRQAWDNGRGWPESQK